MIQQNTKKLIESQTKKLFIISLALFFFEGDFFIISQCSKNAFCSFRGWVYFESENLHKKYHRENSFGVVLIFKSGS